MILGIDPGTTHSAYVVFLDGKILDKGILTNPALVRYLTECQPVKLVALEFVQCYGMAVGREVFETVFWSGIFAQVAGSRGLKVQRFGRPTIKSFVTGMGRAKDPHVRQAMMMRYGGTKKGEPLYGVTKDIWSALAVVTYVHEASKTGELKEW